MRVLGIGGSSHDYAYCLVEDGKIKLAIEEERISREKHSNGSRSAAFNGIEYCLKNSGITMDDIDVIVSNNCMAYYEFGKLYNKDVVYINHHLAHAASAYYTSGVYDSAILILDGLGDHITTSHVETVTKAYGLINTINVIDKKLGRLENIITEACPNEVIVNTNSLGTLYEIVTRMCGFSLFNEGKTMGLAAYGSDRYYKMFFDNISYINNELHINLQYIMDFIYHTLNSQSRERLFQVKADVAYAVQKILEHYFILFANELYEQTHSKNLSLAGGMAYNSSSNGRLLFETKFENIHVFPAAGDAGTAVGAALYGYYCIGGNKFYGNEKLQHAYLGRSYTNNDVVQAAEKFSEEIIWEKKDRTEFIRMAAQDLKDGKIIGWFHGGAEFGPRALGHRSILANPAIKNMKDIINQRVKFRENFRPFAPSILKEYVHEYFEYTQEESNFMLFICKVRDEKTSVIPAVTHVDQSARIQTVTRENNGIFYDLIYEFNNQTGIPLLLNTSFNLKDEPIVETPENAIVSFKKSKIDVLYINDYIIKKKNETANNKAEFCGKEINAENKVN